MNKLISVVIPCYNNKETIERAINSVAIQTYANIELIVVDDGSTDNTYEVAEEAIKKSGIQKVVHIRQKNAGPSVARNVGIKTAKGEYIAFLDADDEWLPQKLQRQIEIMEELDIELLGCSYNLIKAGKAQEFRFSDRQLQEVSFKALLFKHYFATPCCMVKRTAIIEVGMFKEGQHFMEDAYLFANMARKFRAFISGECLVNIYKLPFGESGLSSRLKEMEKYELENLKLFRRENDVNDKKLGLATYAAAYLFSIAKYIRRILIVKLRKEV